jgi:endonuclease/exonuclease/phosphatase family metal-dependent hydrolase
MQRRFACLTPAAVALVVLAGCINPAPTAPKLAAARAATTPRTSAVSVMTQNMYVGADLDAVIGALASPDPNDDVPALLHAVATLGTTDYPARAGAFAQAIDRARPAVVGLQEVSQIDINLTALGLPGETHLDFLAILADSLQARGLHYVVAVKVQNIVAQPVPGISLVDYDAMLVDADRVTVVAAAGNNYAANIGVVAPGVELKRGWVRADVTIDGRPFSLASTHLESGDSPGVPELRAAQIAELVASLPAVGPVIVMGDFNDTPGSPMYRVIAGAGFTDSWAALRPGVPGVTCCELPDLSNQVAQLDQRIDYVWTRIVGDASPNGMIERIGAVPADRVAGPDHLIWPSDHAGLVRKLETAP